MDNPDDLLTLPTASLRVGVSLDRLRRAAAADGGNPAVRALLVRVGDRRCVRVRDLDRLKAAFAASAK